MLAHLYTLWHLFSFYDISSLYIIYVTVYLADGDENSEEGTAEEQQGSQKPKKVQLFDIYFKCC